MTAWGSRLDGRQRSIRATIFVILVLGFSILAAAPSLTSPLRSLFGGCAFHSITGLPCAFCGGTRAAKCLLHGDLSGAFYFNAFAVILLLGSFLLCMVLLIELTTGRMLLPGVPAKWHLRMLLTSLLIVLAWWAIHVVDALYSPKPEVADLSHPVVRWLRR